MRAPGSRREVRTRKPLFQRTELIIHFHAQGLKNLCGRMQAPVTANDFFDGASQRNVSRNGAVLRAFTIKLAIRRAAGSSPIFAE